MDSVDLVDWPRMHRADGGAGHAGPPLARYPEFRMPTRQEALLAERPQIRPWIIDYEGNRPPRAPRSLVEISRHNTNKPSSTRTTERLRNHLAAGLRIVNVGLGREGCTVTTGHRSSSCAAETEWLRRQQGLTKPLRLFFDPGSRVHGVTEHSELELRRSPTKPQ